MGFVAQLGQRALGRTFKKVNQNEWRGCLIDLGVHVRSILMLVDPLREEVSPYVFFLSVTKGMWGTAFQCFSCKKKFKMSKTSVSEMSLKLS